MDGPISLYADDYEDMKSFVVDALSCRQLFLFNYCYWWWCFCQHDDNFQLERTSITEFCAALAFELIHDLDVNAVHDELVPVYLLSPLVLKSSLLIELLCMMFASLVITVTWWKYVWGIIRRYCSLIICWKFVAWIFSIYYRIPKLSDTAYKIAEAISSTRWR